MANKLHKEFVSMLIVILTILVGFVLIFWFYQIINRSDQPVTGTKKSMQIKDDILQKVTTETTNEPLKLNDSEFGRENPFSKY